MGQALKPDYIPYGAADQLMGCRDLQVLMEGPAGTGKSRGVLQKVHYAALKYPGMRGLIVRKTRESMTESVLVTYEQKVLPKDSPIAAGVARNTRASYTYPNGSCIVIGGMKANGADVTAKIMSTEYDLVACFESTELTEEDWEKLLTRLRNGVMPYQQAIADCNPAGPHHWLNQRANKGNMTRLLSRHTDNPMLFDAKSGSWTDQGAKYITTLKQLTGARASRLLEGKWAATEGAVYDQFDAAVHVVETMPKGWEAWRKFRTIDWGYTNPFVCQWWAVDPDGRLWLYREIYKTKTLVEDHARRIKELSQGETITADVTDHDAEDRATYDRHCARSRPAYKAIKRGIEAVQARLRKAGDGKPRIFVLSTALVEQDALLLDAKKPTCTAHEFDGYVWPKGQDGKPMKEEPVDENNHGMDALRYAVAYVDNLAGTRITFTGSRPVGV